MKDILSPRAGPFLRELARSRLLLAFDHDGVLAPLVTAPGGAGMRPATRRLRARAARRYPAAVVPGRAWREMGRRLAGAPGVEVKDKQSTLSVRNGVERTRRRAEEAVLGAVATLGGARLVRGALSTALHLGDAVTDEDAFAIVPPAVVGVRVGPGRSLAGWRLAGQQDVDRLLQRLVELRRPGGLVDQAGLAPPACRAAGRRP